ncbi:MULTISPECIES: TIGR03087 family PEP-CTERM/XrtA system glycosyltransferase [Thauera]|uniref:Sugar transferase n=2 Tax=Thauera aminoaromatica TaxID=164330 RepID=N6Z7N9_THASP|nr:MULTISPECIES: TIGR03087 family PEP-CTERM/XrtA system glycosyltransferase [Thauera]ENO88194.1 sugar transferase [Thauera aminoaromatica S2]KIN90437.1 glycosyl transferases group 1 family protein [Thauera sp. SWB20]OPZ06452.1 MAG: Glycosyl transferases group 1 [Alphaproteobacteria bacterium ADurb.BinA305]TXH85906.1 MAG: TIGR03087 family PEP-CTERM/XrtA system glycosyltransferase [Thauera aminoaromatica]
MQDSRPPLLYLTHRIPYPPNKGDKLRSFNILRQLARTHRVWLGSFVDHADDRRHIPALRQWCEQTCVIPIEPGIRRLASLRGLLRGEALSLPYYRSPRLARWVDQVVAENGIRSAVAFSGPMAQYLDVPGLSRRVVDFCDVDSAKWTQYAADRRWPMSWLYRREGERLLDFERRAAAGVEASLFVTEAEAEVFRRAAPEVGDRVGVMQNGVDAEYFAPANAGASPYPAGAPVIAFSGAMDYWPNVDAVCWFATELLPAIRRAMPGVRFWIVGMNPAPAVQALAGEDVVVTGTVPDVRPYIAHADLVVAPLRIARGIQNKVLEAMAMARPVVLSAAPAVGLAARDGVECSIAEDGDELCRRVVELLGDPSRRAAIGAAARDCVLRAYSWSAHLRTLDWLLDAQGTDAGLAQAVQAREGAAPNAAALVRTP